MQRQKIKQNIGFITSVSSNYKKQLSFQLTIFSEIASSAISLPVKTHFQDQNHYFWQWAQRFQHLDLHTTHLVKNKSVCVCVFPFTVKASLD